MVLISMLNLKFLRIKIDQDLRHSLWENIRKWSLILTIFITRLNHTWLNPRAFSLILTMIWLLMKNTSCRAWLQHANQATLITHTFWMSISSIPLATIADQRSLLSKFLWLFCQESTKPHTALKHQQAIHHNSSVSSTLLSLHSWKESRIPLVACF